MSWSVPEGTNTTVDKERLYSHGRMGKRKGGRELMLVIRGHLRQGGDGLAQEAISAEIGGKTIPGLENKCEVWR